MIRFIRNWLWKKITTWLTVSHFANEIPTSDFERLRYEIRPCDILLVEGRSRVSHIIKNITLSHWTHSALYIGRLHDIDDPVVRSLVQQHYPAEPHEQLLIEAVLGLGTIITPLSDYRADNLRICRPSGISRKDSQSVIAYCARKLGTDYNVRQLLDLARFLFPYGLLPRRWRSSLFRQNAGAATRTVCSTMLAEAFASIHFPILPVLKKKQDGRLKLYSRNFMLITPREFDYSPYFDIIKYPVFGNGELEVYRQLPWDEKGQILNDEFDVIDTLVPELDIPTQAITKSEPNIDLSKQQNNNTNKDENTLEHSKTDLSNQSRDMMDNIGETKPSNKN